MKRKEDILNEAHWTLLTYKQRMKAEDWRELLLNGEDKIIFRGRLIKLIGKNLGCGVYEVSKAQRGGERK